MVPSSCEVEVDRNSEPLLTLAFLCFRLHKVRVTLALRGFIRKSFNDIRPIAPDDSGLYMQTPAYTISLDAPTS